VAGRGATPGRGAHLGAVDLELQGLDLSHHLGAVLHELVVLDALLGVLALPLVRLGVQGIHLLQQLAVLLEQLLLLGTARLDLLLEPLRG